MAGFERGSPQWGFTSYLILILFGALVFNTGPLDSDRPLQDNEGRQNIPLLNVAPARLWQDPFESIVKHRKNIKKYTAEKNKSEKNKSEKNKSEKNKSEKNKSEKNKSDNSVRKSAPSHPFHNSSNESDRFNEKLKVIGVMINSGPYAEIVERRIRRRYAILSGLAQQGFIPEQVNFTNYFHWPAYELANIDMYDFVPYEWFFHEKNEEYLLVLWLQDEAFLQNPKKSFESLISTFADEYKVDKRIDFRFIGPATSTLLKKLTAYEDNEFPYLFLSPTATVPEKHLGGSLPRNIIRTIATDDQLAHDLIRELQTRQPEPEVTDASGEHTMKKSHVALISEHDTVFGRTMPQLIAKELGCCYEDLNKCEQLLAYSYLRGIDGQTHEKSSLLPDNDSKDKSKKNNIQHQPVGSSQYDYLRRLAKQLQVDERKLREEGKGSLRYIGIFGNDVYDKLLILQAVRPFFPKAVFFTTDLDARLLQESEHKWTRNLVVASSFGLRLERDMQGNIPPFRDSYQTSVFHAIQLALKSRKELQAESDLNQKFRPLIYEVGRKRAVRINLELEDGYFHEDHNPEELAQPNIKILFAVFFILAAGIFAYYHTALKHRRVKVTKWLSVVWLVLGVLTILAYTLSFEQEPFSFTDGVSTWPTIYIRSIAALLSIYLLFHSIRKLKKNYIKLSSNYFEGTDCAVEMKGNTKHIWFFLLATVALFVLCMIFIDLYLLFESVAAWSVLIAFYFYFIIKKVKIKNIGSWAGEKAKRGTELLVTRLWCQYGDYGQPCDRVYRSLAITILYLSFACILFMLLGAPNVPSRGFYVFLIDKAVLVPAVIGLMLLLFLIVDETRLCTTWIYKFIDRKIIWPQDGQKQLKDYDVAYHPYVTEWLNVQLIADRTQTVGKLLYYPFFIIVLMLISRSTFFDNWSFPVALVMIFGTNVVIAIFCAVRLRQAAEKVRENALNKLSTNIIELRCEPMIKPAVTTLKINQEVSKPESVVKKDLQFVVMSDKKIKLIEELIKDIHHINTGAFQSLKDQPFVRATIIVFGAAGLTITEYLRLSS